MDTIQVQPNNKKKASSGRLESRPRACKNKGINDEINSSLAEAMKLFFDSQAKSFYCPLKLPPPARHLNGILITQRPGTRDVVFITRQASPPLTITRLICQLVYVWKFIRSVYTERSINIGATACCGSIDRAADHVSHSVSFFFGGWQNSVLLKFMTNSIVGDVDETATIKRDHFFY